MKKLFSLITLFVLAIGLVGCNQQEITDLENQIAELEATIQLRDAELATIYELYGEQGELSDSQEAQIDQLEIQIEGLQQLLEDLQASTYDNVISITVTALDGSQHFRTLGVDDDTEYTFFDLLRSVYTVGYSSSEFGHYVTSVANVFVPTGSYMALYKNQEMSMVGVDDVTFTDGDSFEFKVEWWDMTQKAVYDAIMLFMENQLDDYLTDDYIDYNVLLACGGMCNDYFAYTQWMENDEFEMYVDSLPTTTVQEYFKAIMLSNAYLDDTHTNELITGLDAIISTGPYGQTAYGLLALDSYNHGLDYDSYVNSSLAYYQTNTPLTEGLDAGSIAIQALANHTDLAINVDGIDTTVQSLIDEFVNWVIAEQLPSGGVKTEDITWGDTVYPGTENAASMSQLIIGLIANDINPASGDFVQGDNNLILRLTQYQLPDGSFDWNLEDDIENDKAFSTPQAFLALTTYFKFMNSSNGYNDPYDFHPFNTQ